MPRRLLALLLIAPAFMAVAGAQTRDLRLIDALKNDDRARSRPRAGDGATALQWAVYQENDEAVPR